MTWQSNNFINDKLIKTIFYLLSISIVVFIFPSNINANKEHLKIISFLNQVRGRECCDPGSIDQLQTQINAFNDRKITSTFAIRYDALIDEEYTLILKNYSHEIAGLLEVTPSLAKEADVTYHGNSENWYQANHVFLVGYSLEERARLVDTYMEKFFDVFGFYPTTTSAWQIDSSSLNYLEEKYKITTHQITRNQWGTDSYTMYGGPFHYPYFASKNWPLMPGNSDVLIIRQTVSDPLKNYADHTASHTSQPNDYMQNKDFSYFDKLLTQTLSQVHNSYSFALLGLENSMDERFQNEYIKQIEWIYQFAQNNSSTQIVSANKIKETIIPAEVTITHGKNLTTGKNQEAIYITTKKYQARIYRDGSRMTITDFRLYSPSLSTITKKSKSPTQSNYWIAPFAIDSSRSHLGRKSFNLKDRLKKIFEPRLPDFPTYNPSREESTNYIGLKLPDIDPETEIHIDSHEITYKNPKNSFIKIQVDKDLIKINKPDAIALDADFSIDENTPFTNFPEIKFIDNTLMWDEFFQIKIDNTKEESLIIPSIFSTKINPGKSYNNSYFPGLDSRAVEKNSYLVAHNPIAIAGKNPIRIFAYTLDENDTPSYGEISINSSQKSDTKEVHRSPNSTDTTWTDIYSKEYGKRTIQGYFEKEFQTSDKKNESFDKIDVYFVPNCRTSLVNCLTHPSLMLRYIQLQINTKALQIVNKLK